MIRAGSAPCIFIFAAYGLMVQCWSSENGLNCVSDDYCSPKVFPYLHEVPKRIRIGLGDRFFAASRPIRRSKKKDKRPHENRCVKTAGAYRHSE